MSYYDVVIIGAGPSGLALAHACSMLNMRIAIIDKETTIGGCHRVKRENGLFTEHGPRIYLSNYVNVFNLLHEMGLKIEDIFTDYNYSFLNVAINNILPHFSLYEIFVFTVSYFMYIIDSNHGKKISLSEYLIKYNFSQNAIDILDRLCRFTDGGDVNRYSLNKLLRLQDALLLVKIYQPKQPLDTSLFKIWKAFLEQRNVTFLLNKNITYIHKNQQKVEYIILNDKELIYLDKLILAIPPTAISQLLEGSSIQNCFGDNIEEWAENTKYLDYISITYHFKETLQLSNINGLTLDTDWGIAVINLSNYMPNIEKGYKTVLSTAISVCNKNSKYIHKTANECSKQELIKEVHRQIKKSLYNNLSDDYRAILNPNNYYNVQKNKWENIDKAYFNTIGTNAIRFDSKIIDNVYNVGTHNGASFMDYTTMESAVSNGLVLACMLYPELKNKYYLRNFLRGKDIIAMILIIIVIIIIIYK